MIEALDQAFTRQRRFVADASHELRTPVAAIRSKTVFATLGRLSLHEANRLLGDIHAEAEHLGRLISDFLALARGDEGQTQFDREPVQLDQLALAVAANAEHLEASQGVTVQVQVAEPVTVVGDEARLIGVVMNLLDNAILYTQTSSQVTLSVKRGL